MYMYLDHLKVLKFFVKAAWPCCHRIEMNPFIVHTVLSQSKQTYRNRSQAQDHDSWET
jgi:hypothetical protein